MAGTVRRVGILRTPKTQRAGQCRPVFRSSKSHGPAVVTQYEMTWSSGGGATVRSTLSVRCMFAVQLMGSVSIAQHGLFVDDAGVVRLLHCCSTVSIWFALP